MNRPRLCLYCYSAKTYQREESDGFRQPGTAQTRRIFREHQRHLKCEITLGTYLFVASSQARFMVLAAEDDHQFAALVCAAKCLPCHRIPTYLETSRRGGHLWFFFEELIPGKDVRKFGKGVIQTYRLVGIELYPKQDRIKEGPRSLILLPFGIHRKSMKL